MISKNRFQEGNKYVSPLKYTIMYGVMLQAVDDWQLNNRTNVATQELTNNYMTQEFCVKELGFSTLHLLLPARLH
jgi:hypothetical protein